MFLDAQYLTTDEFLARPVPAMEVLKQLVWDEARAANPSLKSLQNLKPRCIEVTSTGGHAVVSYNESLQDATDFGASVLEEMALLGEIVIVKQTSVLCNAVFSLFITWSVVTALFSARFSPSPLLTSKFLVFFRFQFLLFIISNIKLVFFSP